MYEVGTDLRCPCGSSDAFAFYEDGHGFCFSNKCGTQYFPPNKLKIENMDEDVIQTPAKEVIDLPTGEYSRLDDRNISVETCRKYGVTVEKAKGIITYRHYPYLSTDGKPMVKTRNCEAKRQRNNGIKPADPTFVWSNRKGLKPQLFGQQFFGKNSAKAITIVEGEDDALAAFELLGSRYPVVSIPDGAGKSAVIAVKDNYEYLNSFSTIVLCFDNDAAGQSSVKPIASLFPGKAKIMRMSRHKDAAEYLENFEHKDFVNEWWQSDLYTPDGVITGQSFLDALFAVPTKGTPLVWPSLSNKTHGIRKHELWTFGGGTAAGKCLGKGTLVTMFDGTTKPVENIKWHDLLMGDDGTPRKVLSVTNGKDKLYRVSYRGGSYVVNSAHILSLKYSVSENRYGLKKNDVVNINVEEYINSSPRYKSRLKGYKVGWQGHRGWHLDTVTPYIVGMWLGDGTLRAPAITNVDQKLIDHWYKFADSINHAVSVYDYKDRVPSYNITAPSRKHGSNKVVKDLVHFGYNTKKIIPDWVYSLKIEHRLQLLAGLIDTDGSLGSKHSYEITQVSKHLAHSIERLALSCGFNTALNSKAVKGKTYYRVYFSGSIERVPVLLDRKKGVESTATNSLLRTITVEEVGYGEYYGFELDGNKLFVLGDGTVTHNTELLKEIGYDLMVNHDKRCGFIMLEEPPERTIQCLVGKDIDKRIYLEDVDTTGEERKAAPNLAKIADKAVVYDHHGMSDFENIKEKIEYFVTALNCEYIFLDHITAMAEGKEGDVNAKCHYIMEELNRLLQSKDFSLFLISHLRKATGKTAEEGGRVTLDDMYGSGAIKQRSNFVFGIEGNQQSEDETERNLRYIRCLKDRNTGSATGSIVKLEYNQKTGRLLENDEDLEELYKGLEE